MSDEDQVKGRKWLDAFNIIQQRGGAKLQDLRKGVEEPGERLDEPVVGAAPTPARAAATAAAAALEGVPPGDPVTSVDPASAVHVASTGSARAASALEGVPPGDPVTSVATLASKEGEVKETEEENEVGGEHVDMEDERIEEGDDMNGTRAASAQGGQLDMDIISLVSDDEREASG
jgi:hypothetical protein